jgi:ribosomal protein L11 methyltransferase
VRVAALRGVRARDWRRFWRRHFRAQAIGARLAVVPAWQRASARRRWPRRRAVVLDPGLSFGTGDHFTTRFCLEQIDARCAGRPPRSLLDVGTGSGVLAIAAAKLGVARVVATDHDPQALAAAARNARANRVAGRVRLEAADIAVRPPRGRFDIVCANLHGRLLAGAAPRLAAACRRVLVASGLREEEADAVAAAFAAEGLVERVRDGDGEWCGLVLER